MEEIFRKIHTERDLQAVYTVVRELRPHLDLETFRSLLEKSEQADQYTLVGAFQENRCVAAMGYRTLHDFAHGTHLYIDDLVTRPELRSLGIGKRLLEHAKNIAKKQRITLIRLSSGVQRTQAHQFYEKNDWAKKSFGYCLEVPS